MYEHNPPTPEQEQEDPTRKFSLLMGVDESWGVQIECQRIDANVISINMFDECEGAGGRITNDEAHALAFKLLGVAAPEKMIELALAVSLYERLGGYEAYGKLMGINGASVEEAAMLAAVIDAQDAS